jgi:hypothetical protein
VDHRRVDILAVKKEGRFYELPDGTKLPSVTTLLSAIAKPALINWASYGARDATIAAARAIYEASDGDISPASFEAALRKTLGKRPAHLAKSDEALDIGTLVHARIEAETRRELGEAVELPEIPETDVDGTPHPAWNALASYHHWRMDHDVKPIAVEQRVYSVELGFAGTCDLVAYVDGVLTIADYKTSKAVYPEYRLQIAAYRAAYNTDAGANFIGGLILRFPKERGDAFEAADVPWEDQESLMRVFLAAKEIWHWMK